MHCLAGARLPSSNSELFTTELLKTVCIPVLTYAVEITNPNWTVTLMLNNLINGAICKVLNWCDGDTVNE